MFDNEKRKRYLIQLACSLSLAVANLFAFWQVYHMGLSDNMHTLFGA